MGEPPIYTKPSPQGYTDALRQIRILEDRIASLEARLRAAEEALRKVVDDHEGCERSRGVTDGPRNYESERLAGYAYDYFATASGEGEDGECVCPDENTRVGNCPRHGMKFGDSPDTRRYAQTAPKKKPEAEPPGVVLSAETPGIEDCIVAIRVMDQRNAELEQENADLRALLDRKGEKR